MSQAAAPEHPPLYRDTMEYAPFKLTWTKVSNLSQVHGVFPSPIKPQHAALATEAGLFFTTDSGRTWTALPEAAAAKVGLINDVAFHPMSPDTFYIASQTSGVWATTDQGKTFKHVGTKDKGLASDTVVSLIVYSGDPSHQTLLAVHGDTPGLSRSRDNGATWDVVNTDYKFRRLTSGEGAMNEFFLIGSTVKDGDIQNIYSCSAIGEYVMETLHDVVPTDLSYAPGLPIPYGKSGTLYATTSDSGAYHIEDGAFGDTHNAIKLAYKDIEGWASVGSSWGPNADVINLFLYDPTKAGLVVSSDDLATSRTASDGLLLSSIVKDGAVIRPNNNGTVFYNVVNGTLAVGRMPAEVPIVEVDPPAVEVSAKKQKGWRDITLAFQKFNRDTGSPAAAAKSMVQGVGDLNAVYRNNKITITAQLPVQPAPPTSVTVDMSRFGGTPTTPLFDDGKHDDGAAGDGLYSATVAFSPENHRLPYGVKDWRTSWPGRVGLGVTATFADGHHTGAVAVETIYTQINDITPWRNKNGVSSTVEGEVTADTVENPREVHNGAFSLSVKIPKGHWAVHIKIPEQSRDITSYEAVAFWLKLVDGEAPKEFTLQLKDHPEFSDSTTTDSTPVLNGVVPKAEEQRVTVPIGQLLTNPKFQSDHLSEIILSGDSTAPATLLLTDLQILAQNDQSATPASTPTPK